jgi:hypothetical protein
MAQLPGEPHQALSHARAAEHAAARAGLLLREAKAQLVRAELSAAALDPTSARSAAAQAAGLAPFGRQAVDHPVHRCHALCSRTGRGCRTRMRTGAWPACGRSPGRPRPRPVLPPGSETGLNDVSSTLSAARRAAARGPEVGQRPVTPSRACRSRSAWPLCRAYSPIRWT